MNKKAILGSMFLVFLVISTSVVNTINVSSSEIKSFEEKNIRKDISRIEPLGIMDDACIQYLDMVEKCINLCEQAIVEGDKLKVYCYGLAAQILCIFALFFCTLAAFNGIPNSNYQCSICSKDSNIFNDLQQITINSDIIS